MFHLKIKSEKGKIHDLGYFIAEDHRYTLGIAYRRASTEGFNIVDRNFRVYIEEA